MSNWLTRNRDANDALDRIDAHEKKQGRFYTVEISNVPQCHQDYLAKESDFQFFGGVGNGTANLRAMKRFAEKGYTVKLTTNSYMLKLLGKYAKWID